MKIEDIERVREVFENTSNCQEGLDLVRREGKNISESFRGTIKPLVLDIIKAYSENKPYFIISSKNIMVYLDDGIQGSYSGERAYFGFRIICAERKIPVWRKGDEEAALANDIEKYVKASLVRLLLRGSMSCEDKPEEKVDLIRVTVAEII